MRNNFSGFSASWSPEAWQSVSAVRTGRYLSSPSHVALSTTLSGTGGRIGGAEWAPQMKYYTVTYVLAQLVPPQLKRPVAY